MDTRYTATVVYDEQSDYEFLVIEMVGKSVDEAINRMKELPETKKFLADSTLGFEYIDIQFNHGANIIFKIPRYA